ncbi:universal stress protein [Halobaculum sp. MBLA0143]|uniref:universal stress protein n=1 Tax=Halobaculum sp. MBLA0143 TaxID=3079933 RepID=UPI0035265B60
MYDAVLAATDGSDHARVAAAHAVVAGRRFDADVPVVSVADRRATAALPANGGAAVAAAAAETAANEALATAPDDDRVETVLARGDPGQVIAARADRRGAGLIAVGTHGRSGVSRYLVGSVAARVIRAGVAPVLVARASHAEPPRRGYRDVVVATDGTGRVDTVLPTAFELACEHDATIHAISVVDTATNPTFTGLAGSRSVDYREQSAEAATERVTTRARKRDFDARTVVETGEPAAVVTDYAARVDADLLAVATAGRSGLSRLLVGSTTERLLGSAPAPVLVARAGPVGPD